MGVAVGGGGGVVQGGEGDGIAWKQNILPEC